MTGAPIIMSAPMMIVVNEGVMMASTMSMKLAMVDGCTAPIGARKCRDVIKRPGQPMQGTRQGLEVYLYPRGRCDGSDDVGQFGNKNVCCQEAVLNELNIWPAHRRAPRPASPLSSACATKKIKSRYVIANGMESLHD